MGGEVAMQSEQKIGVPVPQLHSLPHHINPCRENLNCHALLVVKIASPEPPAKRWKGRPL